MKVSYSFLDEQFKDPEPILQDIKALVKSGDFTLGNALEEFEQKFAKFAHRKYAIGVGTGTDAIRLSLLALGIGQRDEVITTPNTFYATVGAIATTGAKPVFVDIRDDFAIDPSKIEAAITPKTKAIVPVHLNGCPADMVKIMEIAKKHNLKVVEDTCQAIGATVEGKRTGSYGDTGAYSLHPLKNINVWGDGGMIVTDSEEIRDKLILLRNHGLINRDECVMYAYNCRLDTMQAVVGLYVIKQVEWIIGERAKNGEYYDKELANIPQIRTPKRDQRYTYVHHNYVVFAEKRDELLKHLLEKGVDAKIHYPIPLHKQKASEYLGYKEGDFPVTERHCKEIISLPAHQHLTQEQKEYVISSIKEFYDGS